VLNRTDLQPVLWNPITGLATPINSYVRENDRLVFPIQLEGRSSVFVRLQAATGAKAAIERIALSSADTRPFAGASNTTWTKSKAGNWQAWSEEAKRVLVADEQGRIAEMTFPVGRKLKPQFTFTVHFEQLPVLGTQTLASLFAWNDSSDERVRAYSGLARYEAEFEVSEDFLAATGEVILDLGALGRVARLTINGIPAGTRWSSPFRFAAGQALRPGKNRVVVEVANTWLNQLLADDGLPSSERSSWTTWPRLAQWKSQGVSPERSGWLGPLTLTAFPLVTPHFEARSP